MKIIVYEIFYRRISVLMNDECEMCSPGLLMAYVYLLFNNQKVKMENIIILFF